MILRRRALLAALMAAPLPALAAGKGGGAETFVKLTPIVLEFWDPQGMFHTVSMELTVVFPSQTSMNKAVVEKIGRALSAMPWEEFAKGNPAATVKAVALDVLKGDPSTEHATEVLILKLMVF